MGQKKGQPLFLNLSAVTKSYQPIISNLLNGMFLNHNCSTTAIQVLVVKYVMKDRKRTT